MQTAEKIGPVSVDMGDTACKVPYAPDYIQKVQKRGTIGKKRKIGEMLIARPKSEDSPRNTRKSHEMVQMAGMAWPVFLRAHWRALVAADFFTTEVWTARGSVMYYTLFVEAINPPRQVVGLRAAFLSFSRHSGFHSRRTRSLNRPVVGLQ